MVENTLYFKILKQLEKFLLKKVNFKMFYTNYDLILIVPTDEVDFHRKYSLILSAKIFDTQMQRELILEIFDFLKLNLNNQEYQSISRVNIMKSNDPFVNNINFIFTKRTHAIEISNIQVGGVQIDQAFLLKSLVLDKLRTNYATTFILTDGTTINAGIECIKPNFDILIYTGKGLREIFQPSTNVESVARAAQLKRETQEYLLENNYMALIPLENVFQIN